MVKHPLREWEVFQSTPPRGWRQDVIDTFFGFWISIHSTARVETIYRSTRLWFIPDFNPLHREGGDLSEDASVQVLQISIHSTARVETAGFPAAYHHFEISIHSTARVETDRKDPDAEKRVISIHSTARVETWYGCEYWVQMLFQSTPPRGWRPRLT